MGSENKSWKEKVQTESVWIPSSELRWIPDIIVQKYEELRKIIVKCGNSYQAILCAKDFVEISLRISAIMGLIIVNHNMTKEKDFIVGEEICNREQERETSREILKLVLTGTITMGGWQNLNDTLIKSSSVLLIDESIEKILKKTCELANTKITNGVKGREKYHSVVNWRNLAIAHGIITMDEERYWRQLKDLLFAINRYLGKSEREFCGLNELYQNVFLEQAGVERLVLHAGGKKYETGFFLQKSKNELFFFDSYNEKKHEVKLINFAGESKKYKNSVCFETLDRQLKYLSKLSEESEKNSKSRKRRPNKIEMTGEGEQKLACLKNVEQIEEAVFLFGKIKQKMDELQSGILFLQMERGTGKTTLSRMLDGRYAGNVRQKDLNAIVRAYYVGDLNYITKSTKNPVIGDFCKGIPGLYENHPVKGAIGRYNEQDQEIHPKSMSQLKAELEDEKTSGAAMVELLSLYRDIYTDLDDSHELREQYEDNRLVLIIDGIDELGSSTMELLRHLPSQADFERNAYAKNIFILMTARKEEESGLTEDSKEAISFVKSLLRSREAIISVDSHAKESVELLRKYLKKYQPQMTAEIVDQAIQKAEYKFLYVKPYLIFGDRIYRDGHKTAKAVAKNYIQEMIQRYFGMSLQYLYRVMGAIALFGKISIHDICRNIFSTGVTFDAIGCINDLMPLLTVSRGDGESLYEYADTEYREYILEKFPMVLAECGRVYLDSFQAWYEEKQECLKQYKGYYITAQSLKASEIRKILCSEEYPKFLSRVLESVVYLEKTGELREYIELPFVEKLAEFLVQGVETIVTRSVWEELQARMPGLYGVLLEKRRGTGKIAIELLDPYLSKHPFLLEKIGEHCKNNPADSWYDVIFRNDPWKISDTKNMGYGPYRNQYKTEFAKELWNQAVDIMDARRNEISLARYLYAKAEKEINSQKLVISLARYLERMVLSWDDLPERSKYLSVLVRAYLSNAAAFKEYLQDNRPSIQKVLSLPEAEKTDIELVNELKSKMESENILETIRLARESLRKGAWYQVSDFLYQIEEEKERISSDDHDFTEMYVQFTEEIEEMADREEAVCRILVFSHFETLYGALPEDGKCRKLEEYLDMISRKEQWKPEFWLRYAWSVYRHYFGHRKEFIKVRQCFSVFGGIKWCTVDDVIWENSIAVLKDLRKQKAAAEYLAGVNVLEKYADSVSDVQQMKWLQNRYQNASSDPAGMEELTTKMRALTGRKMEQLCSDFEEYDVMNDPYLQKKLETENSEMIMILGILQQLKIEVPKEYRKKICEVLTTQERKAAQEGKVWYQEQLKKWKGDSGGI